MINKVLLIDDDHSTNVYHEIIIEEAGLSMDVEVCTTVDDAISSIKSSTKSPDLIILDINMPFKSGWDFLKEYGKINAIKRARHLIVLSTTKIPEDIVAMNDHYLIDDFYTKPLTVEIIRNIGKEIGHK